jgi:hypothetical protein
LVHSVATERALRGIASRASDLGVVQKLLIEVNVSGEVSKDGAEPQALPSLLELASQLEGIEVRGLMTMAPQDDAAAARQTFRGLRHLRDEYAPLYADCCQVNLFELSMGMSDDYVIAVEEGATILRIGRGIWFDPSLEGGLS